MAQVSNRCRLYFHAGNRWLRCDIKSISLLSNVLLRQAATEAGGAEVLLFRNGFLTEGSASKYPGRPVEPKCSRLENRDGFTHPGITYDLVMELDAKYGVPFEVREIAEAEVRSADELMLTSSIREVLAVTTLDGEPVGNGRPGPIFQMLHKLYQDYKTGLTSEH